MAKGGGLKLSSYTKNIFYAIAILLLIVLLISLFAGSKKSTFVSDNNSYVPNDLSHNGWAPIEGFVDGSEQGSAKVLLFHAKWCGHCVEYLKNGTFDKVTNSSDIKGVSFIKYDADENKELVKKYDVHGFPTIIGINKKDQKVEFTKNRESSQDLIEFANSLL